MKRLSLALSLFVISLTLFAGCGSASVPVESIKIYSEDSYLLVGESTNIEIEVSPSDASEKLYVLVNGYSDNIEFTSNEKEVSISSPIKDKNLLAVAKYTGTVRFQVATTDGEVLSNSLTIYVETEQDRIYREEKEEQDQQKKDIEAAILDVVDEKYQGNNFDVKVDIPFLSFDEFNADITVHSPDFEKTENCKLLIDKISKALYINNQFSYLTSTNVRLYDSEDNNYKIEISPDNLEGKYTRNGIEIDVEAAIESENNPATPSPTPSPTPTVSQESKPTEPPVQQKQSQMVWVSGKGKKYHSRSSCSNMSSPYQITVDDAKAQGRTPCSKCY